MSFRYFHFILNICYCEIRIDDLRTILSAFVYITDTPDLKMNASVRYVVPDVVPDVYIHDKFVTNGQDCVINLYIKKLNFDLTKCK